MLENIITNDNFQKLMEKHSQDIIEYLLNNKAEFSVLCNIEATTFEPQLPEHIVTNLNPITLFTIENYTFESAKIDKDNFYFEAGFGRENFGSLVTVPLYAIAHIIVSESVLYINLTSSIAKKLEVENIVETKVLEVEDEDEEAIEGSFNAFASSSMNKKILDNLKKD